MKRHFRDALFVVAVCAVVACAVIVGYETGLQEGTTRQLGEEWLDGKICYPTRQP